MEIAIAFVVGTVFGALIVLALYFLRPKTDGDAIVEKVKESFNELSTNLFNDNNKQFLTLASEKFTDSRQLTETVVDGKKIQIDTTFAEMKVELEKVANFVKEVEKDRNIKYAELSTHLKNAVGQTQVLVETTASLKNALASTKVRGQWGEKMAEDVLRILGFEEGVNYERHRSIATTLTIPDFTFNLPQGMKVNMDVKFPLDNYLQYCNSEIESDREQYKSQFFKDVRARIKEVTTKEYINPDDHTLDYVILFIPNEQIYGFVNEHNFDIFSDEALKKRVVVCSPLTLYAILAIVRQALDNFKLGQTTSEILALFETFGKQWSDYIKCYDNLGRKIDGVQEEYRTLTTTRTKKLEVQLAKIQKLRDKGLSVQSTTSVIESTPLLIEGEVTELDPEDLDDWTIVGASHIAHGYVNFNDWSQKMVNELDGKMGEWIQPHLETIFGFSQVYFKGARDALGKDIDQ